MLPKVVIAALLLAGLAAPAQADPVPRDDRMYVTGSSEGAVGGNTVNVYSLHLSAAPRATTIDGTMTSCGRPIADTRGGVVWGQGFVQFDLLEDNENLPTRYPSIDQPRLAGLAPRLMLGDLVGPSYRYRLTVTEPDSDPYVVSGREPVHSARRPSCRAIDRTVRRTIRMQRWPQLRGAARVGQTVRLTRPRAEGPLSVRYRWTANGRVVGRRAALRLGPRLEHTYLSVEVRIGQRGKTEQRERFEFSRRVK